MKRLGIIIALVVILVIGGGLTSQLISSNNATPLPVLRQTGDPNGAVEDMLGWKAEQLFLAIGFILFNLIGMGLTVALVMWLLDRGVKVSQAEAANAPTESERSAS